MAVSGSASSSASMKQVCLTTINNLLNQYFANTLGKEKDIAKIVMAIIQQESSFKSGISGPVVSTSPHTIGFDYWNSVPITNLRLNGTPDQKSNITQGLVAWGLMQSMGLNHIRGASSSGKCLMETAHGGQFASTLCVNPGESIATLLGPSSSISNQILAGLVVLESKYVAVKQVGNQFSISGITYNSRIEAAIRGYIGGGTYDTGNGYSSATYVSSVYYGKVYQIANNLSNSPGAPNTAEGAAGGPTITVASGDNQHPPGC